jgi:hypothetical protein
MSRSIWIAGLLSSAMFGWLIGTALIGVAAAPEMDAMGMALAFGFFIGAPGGALAFIFFSGVQKARNAKESDQKLR